MRLTVLVVAPTQRLADRVSPAHRVLRAANSADALTSVARVLPDVVVIASDVPPEGGVALAVRLAPRRIGLVLVGEADVTAALRAGVRVVIGAGEPLAPAIDAAASGAIRLRHGAALPEAVRTRTQPFSQLSSREREVLALAAVDGDPRQLGLTRRTIERHGASIAAKTGAPDLAAAARLARAAGGVG